MSSPTPTAEPAPSTLSAREAQRLETRARLFDAAVAEIGRSGLAGADVSTIAVAAGVARGTFYFHFPTKEHVVVEVERAQEAKIVARLGTRQRELTDLLSVLSLLVREVLAAERRLGPVGDDRPPSSSSSSSSSSRSTITRDCWLMCWTSSVCRST